MGIGNKHIAYRQASDLMAGDTVILGDDVERIQDIRLVRLDDTGKKGQNTIIALRLVFVTKNTTDMVLSPDAYVRVVI